MTVPDEVLDVIDRFGAKLRVVSRHKASRLPNWFAKYRTIIVEGGAFMGFGELAFHEVCHGVIAGKAQRATDDWGLGPHVNFHNPYGGRFNRFNQAHVVSSTVAWDQERFATEALVFMPWLMGWVPWGEDYPQDYEEVWETACEFSAMGMAGHTLGESLRRWRRKGKWANLLIEACAPEQVPTSEEWTTIIRSFYKEER